MNKTVPDYIKNYSDCEVKESIAVLTGGRHRIMEGINLYAKNSTKPLLISGVNGISAYNHIKDIFILRNLDLSQLRVGYNAQNTRENAVEIKAFMEINGINHVTVVTSYYHLPRVYFELKRVGINKLNFCIPKDGKNSGLMTLFLEYIKLLLSNADIITQDWIDGYNRALSHFLGTFHNK